MSLEHAILGFLKSEDLTGYDLKTRCFDRVASHFWTADQAQVYRTLDRLERDGLVTAKIRRQTGKPDRKVYAITAAGQDSLAEWLSEHHPTPAFRDPFLIQLYFLGDLSTDASSHILYMARDEHQERLESLRTRASTFRGGDPRTGQTTDLGSELQRMTLVAAMARERAAIDWLDDCIDAVDSRAVRQ